MATAPPPTLVALVVVAAVSSACLAWAARSAAAPRGARVDWWLTVEDALGIFFVIGMVYASVVQILVRYLAWEYLDFPWTEEFSRLLLIWTTLWGAAALQRHDDHISMTIVFDRLPSSVRKAVRILGDVVVLAALLPVAWYGWYTTYLLRDMLTISLGLPMSVFAAAVALTGTLMIVHTVVLIVRRLRGDEVSRVERAEPG